ncbi:hypothetical protein AURDEDRAFT_115506 [Auricularia subglabra TFB-10046 SS5]|uniref:Integral membrane protein n=1 Tax=Auricularia subglabra (strain TFB-10046 / SS5) TaxID=717982 RepID=J0DDH4_AURST|nr:hypothetical protein AURDEDRAFT_115506 [Auricularia subglabra TFB-10046 SS5]
MGSADIPPAHVPAHVVPVSNIMLQTGGALWTLCYILLIRASNRTKSYGMPLFALALNVGWEIVYGLLVAEEPLERTGFQVWLLVDVGLVYGLLTHGRAEWAHAPLVRRHLGTIFAGLCAACVLGHWSFVRWAFDSGIGAHRGKTYAGTPSADTTEMGFWSAAVCQVVLSAASVAQLLVRGSTRGVSWGVWASRTLGSVVGFNVYYGFRWWYWPEGHDYVVTPFGLFLASAGLCADLIYPVIFAHIRANERAVETRKQ